MPQTASSRRGVGGCWCRVACGWRQCRWEGGGGGVQTMPRGCVVTAVRGVRVPSTVAHPGLITGRGEPACRAVVMGWGGTLHGVGRVVQGSVGWNRETVGHDAKQVTELRHAVGARHVRDTTGKAVPPGQRNDRCLATVDAMECGCDGDCGANQLAACGGKLDGRSLRRRSTSAPRHHGPVVGRDT